MRYASTKGSTHAIHSETPVRRLFVAHYRPLPGGDCRTGSGQRLCQSWSRLRADQKPRSSQSGRLRHGGSGRQRGDCLWRSLQSQRPAGHDRNHRFILAMQTVSAAERAAELHRVVAMQRTLWVSVRRSGDGAQFHDGHRRNCRRGRSGFWHQRPLRKKHVALCQSLKGASGHGRARPGHPDQMGTIRAVRIEMLGTSPGMALSESLALAPLCSLWQASRVLRRMFLACRPAAVAQW